MFRAMQTGHVYRRFYVRLIHVRFEWTIHCTRAKYFEASSRVHYLSCFIMDIQYVTLLVLRLIKERALVHLEAKHVGQ
jgi:hypothetical protein